MTALDEAIRTTIMDSVEDPAEGEQADVITEWVVVAYRQNVNADGHLVGVPDVLLSHQMPIHHVEGLLLAGVRQALGE